MLSVGVLGARLGVLFVLLVGVLVVVVAWRCVLSVCRGPGGCLMGAATVRERRNWLERCVLMLGVELRAWSALRDGVTLVWRVPNS